MVFSIDTECQPEMCQLKTEKGKTLKIHKILKPGTRVETALPFFKISAVKKIPGGKMSKHKYNLMYSLINTFGQTESDSV